MPRRTNDFQRLVYEVERLLTDDARVTESKLLRDLVTGAKREVDVSVEVPVGRHSVAISIECRDQTRAADVTWVEQMKAKHERLPTNVLTLVSSSGFTPGALEVADRYGIETVSLEEVSADDAARIVGKLSSLWCKSVELSATECWVRVEAVQGLPVETFKASPDLLVFAEDGAEIGFLLQYVDLWLRSPEVMRRLLDLGTETHEWFEFRAEPPFAEGLAGGRRIYLRKEAPTVLRAVDWVRVIGKCSFQLSEFPLKHGVLNDVRVAWGNGRVADRDRFLVVSERGDAEPEFSFMAKP